MSETPAQPPIEYAPKTLFDVLVDFWQARGLIALGALVGFAIAFVFIFVATPSYKSQMVISPANPMNGAEVSSLLADDNLFAIRYLVQRVGVANSSDFMRFENTYYGASVAELLIKDPAIVRGVRADKKFPFSSVQGEWSAAELAEYIQRSVRIENVGASSLRRMTYLHPDTKFGMYFLQNIHRVTDEMIRLKLKQDVGQRVRYLQQAIDDTNNPDHKRALTTLLLEQERLRMLVSIESPYAASVVEPASVSVKPVWPSAKLVYPLAVMIGAALGFIVHGFRHASAQGAYYEQDEGEDYDADSSSGSEKANRRRGKKYGYWWKMNHQNINQDNQKAGEASGAAE